MRNKLLLLALLTACSSSGSREERQLIDNGPWLKPTPLLAQQIVDEATRLPWTHGFERLESIRWFASVGEPAYPKLLELAESEQADLAAAALAALGATGDERLVPEVHGIRFQATSGVEDLELERARTLLRLGDWSQLPRLFAGLMDERLYTRTLCIEALREATHEDQGYDPRAGEAERKLALGRWESWWLARRTEGLVSG